MNKEANKRDIKRLEYVLRLINDLENKDVFYVDIIEPILDGIDLLENKIKGE